jgi:hypothetical protein
MPKFTFSSDRVRRGFGTAKLVRPVTENFAIRFKGPVMHVISFDRRRLASIKLRSDSCDVSDDYISDYYFLSIKRNSLLDSKLSSFTLSVTDKGINIKTEEGGQTRSALIRKSADSIRRPKVLEFENSTLTSPKISVDVKTLDEVLRSVSCSASIDETKTEEDMKLNQVHFFNDENCAFSSTLFYASMSFFKDLGVNFSVISSDIPIIRSFASKSGSDTVLMYDLDKHTFIEDPNTGSFIRFNKVNGKRPPFHAVSDTGYEVDFTLSRSDIISNLSWSSTSLEGTSRITLKSDFTSTSPCLRILGNNNELATMPISENRGSDFSADFHIQYLSDLVSGVITDGVVFKYGNPENSDLLEVNPTEEKHGVSSRYFLKSMKQK